LVRLVALSPDKEGCMMNPKAVSSKHTTMTMKTIVLILFTLSTVF
jgi:hypothetical protein